MKKIISLFAFFLFILNIFSQTTGDFRSRQNGNWSNYTTWQRYDGSTWQDATSGQLPTSTTDIWEIQTAHTVTIDADADCENITITGTLQGTANTLNVYGNLTNNGTLDLFNASGTALVFAGTGNATFSGTGATTDIYTIEINKDALTSTVQLSTSNFSVQGATTNAPKFLTLTTGTFRLSGSFTMSSELFIDDSSPVFNNDEGFWLDNPNFTIIGQDGNIEFNGLCHISAGTFNLGNTAPYRFYMNNSSEFVMEGGILNTTGAFYAGDDDPITYNQSGGTINIASMQVTMGYWYCFRVADTDAHFTMSSGTINIINTNQDNREYNVASLEANTNITGGTLNIGTAATSGDFTFEIQGKMPNVVIDNTTNNKIAVARGSTYVYGDFTVKSGSIYTTDRGTLTANQNRNLYFYGNIIANGDFDGFNEDSGYEARLFAQFRGTTNTSISGTATTCEFYDLRVNKGTAMTAELDIQRAITINEADGNDQNRMYVENGTLKFSGTEAINITPYRSNRTICSATGKFIFDNPNLTINNLVGTQNGNVTVAGDIEIQDINDFNIEGNFTIATSSSGNNTINGGNIDVGGNWTMQNDLTISDGSIVVMGSFYMEGNNTNETGDLMVSGGTLTIGNGDDLFRATGNDGDEGEGGSLTMSGGTINVNGRIDIANGTGTEVTSFTMSGGEINVNPQATTNTVDNVEIVYFGDNSIVNFTGGTLTILNPLADKTHVYRDAIDIRGQTGTKNFIGSTIAFGDGVENKTGDDLYPGYSIYIGDGDLQLGNIILNNPTGTNRELICRTNTNILCNNLTITSTNDKYVMTGRNLEIKGNFINNGELDGTTDTYADNHLFFTGSSAQAYSGSGFLTANLAGLTFNNTSTTGVTLDSDIGGTWVNLTDGHVYTSSTTYLTVYGNTPTDLTGGSSANYVQGNLRRAIPNTASADNYDFPVGKTNYRLLEIQGINTSGTGDGFITANVFEGVNMSGRTGGTGIADPTVAEDIYWQVSTDMSAVNVDNIASVRLTYNDPATTPPRTIGQSNNDINGPYNSIGRITAAGTIQSENFDLTNLNPTGNAYLIISEVEPLTGTYTVGATGDYLNLTEVATELRQKFVDDNVYFELLADYDDNTETLPIVFDKLMLTDPAYGVIIRPQAGVSGTVTERDGNTANEALIFIDNIHNLTFDGRPGGTGSSDWIISNTLATDPGPVFEFRNDANTNTLAYLTIKSDNQSTTSGVLVFGTTTETDGNDDNIVQYCDISGLTSTPTIGIYSTGTAGAENSGNIIDNCNIFDYFNAGANTSGILLANDNSNWTISNNRFYQTSVRIFTSGSIYAGIWIESGTNHTINANTIGYATATTTGVTDISGSTGEFCAIYLNVDNETPSNITNNLISGITFSSSNTEGENGLFNGIYLDAGDVNIGTSGNGNTIGTSGNFGTYPIQITTGADAGSIKPIYLDAQNPISVTDNRIGGIQINGDYSHYFRGIQTASASADYLIRGNTIGSTTQTNSIILTGTNWKYVTAIYAYRADDIIIDNNIIANITTNSTSNNRNNRIMGIYSDDTDANTITGNQIYKFTSYSGNQSLNYNSALSGIVKRSLNDGDQTITGNTIYELVNLNANNRDICIKGIHSRSNANANELVSRNFIHSFNSESADATYYGICIEDGGNTIANNMIRLGIDKDGNDITKEITLYGIANLSNAPCNIYYNSVYIGGSGVTNQVDKNSYAFYNLEAQITNLKNNIFINERSNTSGTDSKHYAVFLTYKDNVIADYNIYNAIGTGAVLSGLDNTDFTTLQAHRAYYTNQDMHTGIGDANFVNATGDATAVDLHLTGNTSAYQTGIIVASMTEDYDGTNRSGTDGERTNIGADNGAYAITNAEDIFTPNFNYTPITNKTPLTDGVVDVTITDQAPAGQGVDQTNKPRIYFRRADSDTPANIENWNINRYYDGVLQAGGNGENGIWKFTIEGNGGTFYSDLADNDIIEYFVVAQDQATANPNVWYTKFDATTPDFTNVSTANSWPGAAVDVNFYGIGGNLNGTYTIGSDPTDDFLTLTGSKGFFQNLSALNVTGDIVAIIQEDITEPATYGCGEWAETGTGGYYVTISTGDATMKTLSTSADNHMIRLEGVDRLIIDGQVNGSGRYFTFEQDNTAFSTFTFSNDATNNTISNSYIIGSPVLKPIGTIHFGEAVTTGNDNNTISNNIIWNLSASMPDNSIYARGNTDNSAPNSGNTISGNEIRNFAVTGIWVNSTGNGDGWTISSNTLYNNFATKPDKEQSGIRVEQGSGHTISNNIIGGNSATSSTALWENTGQEDFYGIYMSVSNASVSNISNNTIFDIHKSNTSRGSNEFRGIYVDNDGRVDIDNNNIYNITNDGNDYTNGIYVNGTPANSVSGNNIYNITSNNGNYDFRGIYLDMGNINTDLIQVNDNTIKGITINQTGGNVQFFGINAIAGNYEVKRNTIGGNNAQDKILFRGTNFFRGIYISGNSSVGDITDNSIYNIETTGATYFNGLFVDDLEENTLVRIQNNIFDNLNLTTSNNANCIRIDDGYPDTYNNTIGTSSYGILQNGAGTLNGISLTTNNQGTIIRSNTIGYLNSVSEFNGIQVDLQNTGNFSYQLNSNTISNIITANDVNFTAINIKDGNNFTVDGNSIENISMSNTATNTIFKGIWVSAGTGSIGTSSANTIGHTSTANSISVAGINTVGISLTGDAVVTASNNLIANLTSTSTDATASIKGIEIDGAGVKTVLANTVRDITTSSAKIDITDGILASQGIWLGGTSASSIASNIIYNISANGTANINVAAISENATSATITKNKIYNISNTTAGTGTASGIVLYNLNTGYVANNMISIGAADAVEYTGIWIPQDNANTKNIYYNSVNILDGPTANSYAFLREDNTTPLNVKNNVFSNFANTGNRYAVASKNTNGLTNATINSNCYYSQNTSTTALWGATDNDFSTWIANTGENNDNLSTDVQPSFVDAANCDLHLSDYNNACAFNSVGEVIANVTDDWDGDTRDANHPDIGADEFTPTGHTGEYVWRGWTDTDWATASNWQCGYAPASSLSDKIVVAEGINNAIIGTDFVTAELEVKNNADLIVDAGNLLTVGGLFTNAAGGSVTVNSSAFLTTKSSFTNNGILTLESPSNNGQSGSFIDEVAMTNNGTFNIERFFIQKQYHYFGVPIAAGGNANSSLFCTSSSGNFNANLYTYDETVDISENTTAALAEGWVFVRTQQADPDVALTKDFGYAFYDESDKLVTFTGTPNTGDMSVNNLSYTANDGADWDGWHLVSNPYPSSIDWDAVAAGTLTNLNNAIYVWEGDTHTGTYATYVSGSAGGTGNLVRFIATGQSFFVHATADNAGFTLDNSHRAHSSVNFLKSSSTKDNLLTLKVTKEELSTQTVVCFSTDASNEFDGAIDAYELFGNWSIAPQIYSITPTNKTKLSVNTMPDNEIEGRTLPVGIMSYNGGNCIIELKELNGLNNVHVYFEDLQTHTVFNLRYKNEYSCNIQAGDISDRFILHFNKNNAPNVENPFGKQYAEQDAAFNFSYSSSVFNDVDLGDNIVLYSAKMADGSNLPAWLSFDNTTRTFSGTPKNADVGIIMVQISATDKLGAVGTYDFEIDVQNINDPPHLQNSFADMNTLEDREFNFIFSTNMFVDEDADDYLTYQATLADGSNLPSWLSFNSATRTFSGTPENSDVATLSIMIKATDSFGEFITDEFTLEIQNVNDLPTVNNQLEDQNILLATDYLYYIPENTFNDVDAGDELTLSAHLTNGNPLPNWLSFDNNTASFSGNAEEVGKHDIEITATDKSGTSVSTTFKLSVYSTTDIEEIGEKSVSVYPNPSNGKFYISVDIQGYNVNWKLLIKDINGKIVHRDKLENNKKFINLTGVAPGTYFIEINENDTKIVKTIVIE